MTKAEKTYVSIIIAILLIAIAVIYLYPPIIRHIKCPDDWIQNRYGEYFSIDNKRVDPSHEYLQWVEKNCDIEPTKILEGGF